MNESLGSVRYEKPRIRTLSANEVLSLLGPARALIYISTGDDESSDY